MGTNNRIGIKIALVTLLCLLGMNVLTAQQSPLYSLNMFEMQSVNPAFVGTKKTLSANLRYRNQWIGLEGAPKTLSTFINMPIPKYKSGIGLDVWTESIGPASNSFLGLSYAYHLKLGYGKLSFGMKAGVISHTFNAGKLDYQRTESSSIGAVGVRDSNVSFDIGLHYYQPKSFAGLAIVHLNSTDFVVETDREFIHQQLKTNWIAYYGRAIVLTNALLIKPTIMLRKIGGIPLSFDANCLFQYQKKITFGLGVRTTNSLLFSSAFDVTDYLRIGYAYDLTLSKLRHASKGSHELFFAVDIQMGNKKVSTPRI